MKYRADVDGLRAVAVLPVVLFHAGAAIFSGGYVGVDVFFVISGFVIASRILEDIKADRFSYAGFYERRLRRLGPAMAMMYFFSFVAAVALFLPDELTDFARSLVASILFSANFFMWRDTGYFAVGAETKPLLHMWSLAVEEQFYLVAPFLLTLIGRLPRPRYVLALVPLALLSFAISWKLLAVAPTANFYLLPGRAWELLIGVLLAASPPPSPAGRGAATALGALGLGLIGFAVFFYSEATPFPGPYALVPCLGAALVIAGGRGGQGLAASLLASRPMVWVGLRSYSLYLFHWPIAVYVRHLIGPQLDWPWIAFVVAASLICSDLSYRFVERPFRERRADGAQAPIAPAAVACVIVLLLAGGLTHATRGFPRLHPGFSKVAVPAREEWNLGDCFLETDQPPSRWKGEACLYGKRPATTLLWGDSFAAHYVPGIRRILRAEDPGLLQYTSGGCPPILSYRSAARPFCEAFNARIFDIIRDFGVMKVIMASQWGVGRGITSEKIVSTVRALERAGVEVSVIGQSPEFGADVQALAYRQGQQKLADVEAPASNKRDFNVELSEKLGAAKVIDPIAILCPNGICAIKANGDYIYFDFGHFSAKGAEMAVRAYFPLPSGSAHASGKIQ